MFESRSPVLVKKISGHYGMVYACEMHPQKPQEQFFTCSSDKTIRLWDFATGQTLETRTGHGQEIRTMYACDEFLVSGSFDGSCKKWSL